MNQKVRKSKLTFILYSLNKLPIVYNLNRTFLRFYLVFPVFFFIIASIGILIIFNYTKIIDNIKRDDLKDQNISLNNKVKKLNNTILKFKNENLMLRNRLSKGISSHGLEHFSIFTTISGQKYLLNKAIQLEQLKINRNNNKLEIKFNLINKTDGKKRISGYLICLIKNNFQIVSVPFQKTIKDIQETFQLSYKQGQSFSTSMFRPFYFSVPNIKKFQNQRLKIFIFNRLGDLIYISEHNYDER